MCVKILNDFHFETKEILNKYTTVNPFLTKINDIHSFKLIEYIDTMQIR